MTDIDPFDPLVQLEAENETLRNLLAGAYASRDLEPEKWSRDLKAGIIDALERKPVISTWRLGVEQAIQRLRMCKAASEEACEDLINRELLDESLLEVYRIKGFEVAILELERWLNT